MFLRRRVCVYVFVAAKISVFIFLTTKVLTPVPKLIAPNAIWEPLKQDEVSSNYSEKKISETILGNNVPSIVFEEKVSLVIPQNSCSPKTNIMFVKLHKTGTSTIQNLLFRFAVKNDLIVAMPHLFNMLDLTKFHRNILFPLKPGFQYNIFTEHAIFNYTEARAVMPINTVYITILRNPVAQFESGYSIMHLEFLYGMDITAFALLNRSEPEQRELQNRRELNFGRNQQAFDLGLDPELFDDEAAVLEKIQELDEQLDFVMIMERMDESLVLLKKELCWDDLNDIVSVKRNARKKGKKVELSPEAQQNIKEIHRADQMIYDHFYKKFNERLEKFGADRMKNELEQLKMAQQKVTEKCENEPEEKEDLCANLLRFGKQFLSEIFAQQRLFYDVTGFELIIDKLVGYLKLLMRFVDMLSFALSVQVASLSGHIR